jgi:hypothetical protein
MYFYYTSYLSNSLVFIVMLFGALVKILYTLYSNNHFYIFIKDHLSHIPTLLILLEISHTIDFVEIYIFR